MCADRLLHCLCFPYSILSHFTRKSRSRHVGTEKPRGRISRHTFHPGSVDHSLLSALILATVCGFTLISTLVSNVFDQQGQEQLEDRLLTLSERMSLCDRVLKDLRELNSVLVVRSSVLQCFCYLLQLWKTITILMSHRGKLSRMCRCQWRSDQRWNTSFYLFFF